MSTSVRIECDSVSPEGSRLTTFVLRYPRIIHAEVLTHRMFSRNASSSRAIPTSKLVQKDLFIPAKFSKNGKGMQSVGELTEEEDAKAVELWSQAMNYTLDILCQLEALGIHKEHVNRLWEPFSYIDVILTSTEEGLKNFFELRCHKDAQPEIQELALLMKEQYASNQPKRLAAGEWHLPLADSGLPLTEAMVQSVARCARVSYNTHGRESSHVKDSSLYMKLLKSKHMSPFEHQARVPEFIDGIGVESDSFDYQSNLRGWVQLRKLIECNEIIENGSLTDEGIPGEHRSST